MSPSISYPVSPCHSSPSGMPCVHEAGPAEPPKPRLLDRVRAVLRTRHYSRRTEKAYVAWIRRYILMSISLCTSSLSAQNREGPVITGISPRATTTCSTAL